MRLLNVHTRQLSEFFGLEIPPYAILSHTWGLGEVSFQELSPPSSLDSPFTPPYLQKSGYVKINYACLQSIKHGLEWVWVDTCCIDKTSSAELSEAINSMYTWYQDSVECYAYLEDMESLKPNHVRWYDSPGSTRTKGRWFTRGWTLQELIAPAKVFFFSKEWEYLGDKITCSEHLSRMTGIPEDVIRSPNALRFASVASRMSWAAQRETTRLEDIAYSLLGIFGVNMPLLYGEGKKAFIRLQEEILKDSDDQTIFVWDYQTEGMPERFQFRGVLADSPARFLNSANVVPKTAKSSRERPSPYSMTNKGLRIELPHGYNESLECVVAELECQFEDEPPHHVVIALQELSGSFPGVFMRGSCRRLLRPPGSKFERLNASQTSEIYILKNYPLRNAGVRYETCMVRSDSMHHNGYDIVETAPEAFPWNAKAQTLQISYQALLAGYNHAAFRFHHRRTNHSCVVILRMEGVGTHGYVRVLPDMPLLSDGVTLRFEHLEALLDHEIEHESQIAAIEFGKNVRSGSGGRIIHAQVTKDDVLNQKIFILDVGFSSWGERRFDASGMMFVKDWRPQPDPFRDSRQPHHPPLV